METKGIVIPGLQTALNETPFLLRAFLALTALSILAAVGFYTPYPLLFPAALLFIAFALRHPGGLYYLLALSIPVSTELLLPGNLGTDFPSEQIMWTLFGLGGLYLIGKLDQINLAPLYHPATFLLLMLYCWTWFTAAFAESEWVAVKYALAKSWYLGVFYIAALFFFRDQKRLHRWMVILVIAVLVTALTVLFRHSSSMFSFSEVNKVLNPFYRNHVAYACMIGVSVPWTWYLMKRSRKKGPYRWKAWLAILLLLLVATFFSYTRAAIVALVAMSVWPLVIRLRLTKWACLLSVIGGLLAAGYFLRQNNYLEYAPDYYKTITHKKFDRLLEATYQLEDISTMERVYRWIAGYYMMKDRPVTGFGPANFYPHYKSYTVTSFQTYVSDNPERSGIHNYYFMLVVEQGWPGLLLFLAFSFYCLMLAQKLYFASDKRKDRLLVITCAMCMVFVLVISLMNDMIETDKVGSLFFISAAVLVGRAIRMKIY